MTLTLSHQFSLLNPELVIDPYPFYKILRTEAPVYWDKQLQAWLISRYTDVKKLLSDHRIVTKFQFISPDDVERESRRQMWEMFSKTIFYRESSSHNHLRLPLEKVFRHKIENLPEQIQQIVDDLLDAVQNNGRMDIVDDLSEPLPLHVLTKMLGVPVKDGALLKQWGFSLLRFVGSVQTTLEEDKQLLRDMLDVTDYFAILAQQRLKKPKDDLITALIKEGEQFEDLNQREFIIQAGMMLAGGIVVATYPVASGLLTLLQHPEQMQKLKEDSTLVGSTVEELLRYESPSQWVVRRAEEDIKLHGQFIRKNQIIILCLGSANRDETQFHNPDMLDITRKDNHHLAFSYGTHSCLGVPLFRMIAPIAINTILRDLNSLHLDPNSSPVWLRDSSVRRALKSLPVVFEAKQKTIPV